SARQSEHVIQDLPAGVSNAIFGDAPLARGDRVPDFLLPDASGAGKFLYVEARGKPIVVFLARTLSAGTARAQLGDFARFGAGEEARAHCLAITEEDPAALAGLEEVERFPGTVLIDRHGVSAQAFGLPWERLGQGTRTYVLDPNQRVLAVYDEQCADPAAQAFDLVAGLQLFAASIQPRDIAPVLMIPRVFEPELCTRLIEIFHERGARETGTVTNRDGKMVLGVDHAMKKRFDHIIDDRELLEAIHWRFARRVTPEIRKAFRYRIVEAEGFRIACYRAEERGYFRPHRDDVSPEVAHRCFAVSLNLNQDYEGGALRFPEYGKHVYKPEAGEAIIFSCSMLHEAMDVTAGERFVLLGFLLGAEGVQARESLRRRMATGPGGG
ncbi:MAG: 2OG-Fe(II) oxygenase, partial [Gammaproteobacteria bacterium]|nr:2OG-Fe(II) oxygenase [Gammaproteobacteria bacterium]